MDDLEVTTLLELANTRHDASAHEGHPTAAGRDHLDRPDEARTYLAGRMPVPAGEPSADELSRLRQLRDLALALPEEPDAVWRERLAPIAASFSFRFDATGRLLPCGSGWEAFAAGFVPQLFELARIRERLHRCANPTCDWLFLDRSKNHSRVWCEMASCGSRAKMTRYRSRRGSTKTVAPPATDPALGQP